MAAQHFLDKKVTLILDTAAYSADDVFGTPQEVVFDPSLGTDIYIDRIDVVTEDTVAPDLDILLFYSPLSTAQVDHDPLAVDATEFRTLFTGRIIVAAADFTAVAGSDILTSSKTIPAIKVIGGHKYQMVVRTAAGITPAAADNIDIWFRPIQMKVED